jgi:phosphomannomutase/phosphoglucomutase
MSLFGTSGIRGDAKKLFTNQFCFDVGRVFVVFLDKHDQPGPVAVGMDPRGSSPRILEALEQGLSFGGREIVDQGTVPVPALNWILKVAPYAGSIMVSGSHISANLNGLKFFAFKEEILKLHEQEISNIYEKIKNKEKFRKREIDIEEENRANEAYQEMLVDLADEPYPSWKLVIVDPGNGGQSDTMPQVLARLGLKVSEINASIQGEFIVRDTETEGVLASLQKLVKKEKVDMGIAYDYDGDRVVFVDEKGEFIPGDYTGALITKHGETQQVITPINTSQVVEHLGKPVIRTRVGSPYVVEAMKKNKATFGFEANGGGISAEVMMSRDGGSTTIKILNILKKHGGSLSSLINTLPRFHLYRVKVDCPRELNKVIMKEAKREFKGEKVEEIDGVKIWLSNNSWILFRPSSNAPEFRVFAEAKDKEEAKKIAEKGISLVKSKIK